MVHEKQIKNEDNAVLLQYRARAAARQSHKSAACLRARYCAGVSSSSDC
jgi:hypothetical protein